MSMADKINIFIYIKINIMLSFINGSHPLLNTIDFIYHLLFNLSIYVMSKYNKSNKLLIFCNSNHILQKCLTCVVLKKQFFGCIKDEQL